jgi:hypothetical protein
MNPPTAPSTAAASKGSGIAGRIEQGLDDVDMLVDGQAASARNPTASTNRSGAGTGGGSATAVDKVGDKV